MMRKTQCHINLTAIKMSPPILLETDVAIGPSYYSVKDGAYGILIKSGPRKQMISVLQD